MPLGDNSALSNLDGRRQIRATRPLIDHVWGVLSAVKYVGVNESDRHVGADSRSPWSTEPTACRSP
jgi:hypothetical protein